MWLSLFFAVFVSANVSVGSEVRKGPYLIYPGNNTRMMVLWQLRSSQSCILEWGPDTSYSDGNTVTAEYGEDHQHKHTITGLVPGNKYYYRVTVDSNQYPGSFRAAPPEDVNEVRFLGYGDTRTNIFDHDMVNEAMADTFKADANYHTFTLLSGDWVDKGEEEEGWDNEFFNPAAVNTRWMQANLPINGCIGNHEWDDDASPPTLFDKYWPYPYVDGFYWSFDYGPVHIAVVDQYDESYKSGSAQYDWLKRDLAGTKKEWKFLMFHEPGYSAGHHGDNGDVQEYIQPLCEKYKVDIAFCGHNHYYARCDKDGVKHITSGGGGAPLRTGSLNYSQYVEVYTQAYHFCKIHVRGDQLTFTALKPDGTVIDEFTLIHPPPEAWNPSPANGAAGVQSAVTEVLLSWMPGANVGYTGRHVVYFGTDYEAVENATPAAPECKTLPPLYPLQTEWNAGNFELWKSFYWRVDEFDDKMHQVKGNVWTFTTGCEQIPGDINRDCVLDMTDFADIASTWQEERFWPPED